MAHIQNDDARVALEILKANRPADLCCESLLPAALVERAGLILSIWTEERVAPRSTYAALMPAAPGLSWGSGERKAPDVRIEMAERGLFDG